MDNFTPEQIEQFLEQFFNVVGRRQYIGARYVPIFGRKDESTIEWDNTKPYEPLTIVLYQGNSYTSRTYVPTGIAITDTTYWANTGNYNAQVEAYRQEVVNLRKIIPDISFSEQNTVKDYIDDKISEIEDIIPAAQFTSENTVKEYIDNAVTEINAEITNIDNILKINVFEYGAKGDGVTNDTVAIQNAIDDAQESNATVYFPDGIYLVDGLSITDFIGILGYRATLKASPICEKVLEVTVPWLGTAREYHGDNAFIQINIDCSDTADYGIYSTQINAYTLRNSSIRDFKVCGLYTHTIAAEFIVRDCFIRGSHVNASNCMGIYLGEDAKLNNVFMKDCNTGIKCPRGGVVLSNLDCWIQYNLANSVMIDLTDCQGTILASNIIADTYYVAIRKNNGSTLVCNNFNSMCNNNLYTLEEPQIIFQDLSDNGDGFRYSVISNIQISGKTALYAKFSNKDILYGTFKNYWTNYVDLPGAFNRHTLTIPGASDAQYNCYIEYEPMSKDVHIHIAANGTFANNTTFTLPVNLPESFNQIKYSGSSIGLYGVPTAPAELYTNGGNVAELRIGGAPNSGNNFTGGIAGDIYSKLRR